MVRILLGLLILSLYVSFSAQSLVERAREAKKRGEVILNFQSVEIKDLAEFMGELTGKNVIVDNVVRGRISLVFQKPVSIKRAWDIFTSALFINGYGAVEEGGIVKVLPLNEAITVAKLKKRPAEGELTVLVYNLEFTDPQTVMNAIRPFLSPFARVSVHGPSNSVIIADVGENIRKAKKIISSLDREEIEGEVAVFRLKYLSAKDALRLITPLNNIVSRRFGTQLVVSASDEANSLVVFAPKEVHRLVKAILDQVDTEDIALEQRSFYIIPLQFVSAEEISESLRGLLGGAVSGGRAILQRKPAPKPKQGTAKKTAGKAYTKQKPAPSRSVSPIPFITTKEGMKIGFDRGSNSVLLYATKEEYESMKKLISELDVRRKQVLIAATVVEASARSLLDIGIKWQALGKLGGAAFGGSSLTDIYSSFLSGSFVIGTFSETGTSITVGTSTVFFPDLALLFSLLETGSGFNIISNPKVLTLDNQPAVIKVGQVVPYAEGVKFDINGQPIITYDYKEVGLELQVTPRISSNDNLRLTIDLSLQEIVDFVRNEIGTTSYTVPVTSNREVNSDVVVENGQTVILGGLVSTKTIKSMEGIPFISRIPLIGRLFRRDIDQRDKTTLFIFITPYVVSSPEELSKISEEHRKLAEEIKRRIEEKKKEQEEEDEDDFDI